MKETVVDNSMMYDNKFNDTKNLTVSNQNLVFKITKIQNLLNKKLKPPSGNSIKLREEGLDNELIKSYEMKKVVNSRLNKKIYNRMTAQKSRDNKKIELNSLRKENNYLKQELGLKNNLLLFYDKNYKSNVGSNTSVSNHNNTNTQSIVYCKFCGKSNLLKELEDGLLMSQFEPNNNLSMNNDNICFQNEATDTLVNDNSILSYGSHQSLFKSVFYLGILFFVCIFLIVGNLNINHNLQIHKNSMISRLLYTIPKLGNINLINA